MARAAKPEQDTTLLTAALEGLELQRERIEEQIRKVKALLGKGRARPVSSFSVSGEEKAGRRKLSSAARKRIAQAQKRRWAEYRKAAASKGE